MDSREKASTSGVGGGGGKGSQGILRVDASKSHRIVVQVSTQCTIPILYFSPYFSLTLLEAGRCNILTVVIYQHAYGFLHNDCYGLL